MGWRAGQRLVRYRRLPVAWLLLLLPIPMAAVAAAATAVTAIIGPVTCRRCRYADALGAGLPAIARRCCGSCCRLWQQQLPSLAPPDAVSAAVLQLMLAAAATAAATLLLRMRMLLACCCGGTLQCTGLVADKLPLPKSTALPTPTHLTPPPFPLLRSQPPPE